MKRVLTLVALVAVASSSAMGSDYSETARQASIDRALDTLAADQAAAAALRDSIRTEARSRCRGSANALVVRCTLEVARDACKQARNSAACSALADVIVTNHLGEDSFVEDSDRYALMNEAENFRQALDAELLRRYGLLVAELALEHQGGISAAVIDSFCSRRARSTTLPWQRCVAATVWFIGRTAT